MRRSVPRWSTLLLVAVTVLAASSAVAFAAAKPVKVSGTVTVKGTDDVTGDDPAVIDVTLDDFVISPTFTKATPGQALTVNIENTGSATHTFTSKSLGVDVELAPGKSQTLEIPMPERKGAYVYYCRFHRSSGMQGALWSKKGAKASDTPEPDAS